MSATQLLPLTEIHLDSGTQTRVYTSEDAVADYAERLLEGDEFPPIEVFFDGKEYHCADGFHRYMANMRNGAKKILANIHPGTAQDAIWFAIGANRANGIKRTKGDKQNAIAIALAKFPDKTQAEIAKHVGCSVGWVNKVKSEIHTEIRPPATRVNSRGETRPTTYAKAATPPAVPAEVPTPPATQAAPEASHSPQPQGMTLARKAVEMLERIASDDPQRDDALDHVQAWLRHHRQKGNH
jgi:uncharacterized ParB-like nuclease family protein